MWKSLIRKLVDSCEFAEPAAADQIEEAEATLGVKFPEELRSLLEESNGVAGEYGIEIVWPLERIVADNLDFRRNEVIRNSYMPFDHLLFFTDAGNGDQFGFSIRGNGEIRRADIFAWNHEDDSRNWVASSLKDFLERWLVGQIKV